MPRLGNITHELFANALASGKSQLAAYELAGLSGHRSGASRLAKNDAVQQRVVELTARRRAVISRDDVLHMALEAFNGAKQDKQWSAALKAVELLGRELHGMFQPKAELTVNVWANVESLQELTQVVEHELGPEYAKALVSLDNQANVP